MQYGDVVVFLHEFGHLMHHVIGGQNRFAGEGGFFVEGDFVEAPSQMLEEFFHDYGDRHSASPATTRPARCCRMSCMRA